MEDILESFSRCLAFENEVDIEAARSMTKWLENEGVLDYDVLKQTYLEPRPVFHTVAAAANDA